MEGRRSLGRSPWVVSSGSALAWFALLLWMSPAAASMRSDRPLRVLLIGNSYTQANLMPHLLRRISESVPRGTPLQIETVVRGGFTLRKHLEYGEAATRIRRGHYDEVVLQGHSLSAVFDPFELDQSVHLFKRMIDRTGARTVLYATWPRHPQASFYRAQFEVRSFADMASRVDGAYARLAGRFNARVAPVGRAFARALHEAPHLELYRSDGSHPSPAGSFLAASVLYGTLTGQDPRAATYRPFNVTERDAELAKQLAAEALRPRREWQRPVLARAGSPHAPVATRESPRP
jgi:hypothetical protein